jgi:2-dehydropantoate 2-reductase
MKNTPVLIVGTGALATLFASRLAAAGNPVTMLGNWQHGLDAIAQNGARLDGVGSFPVKTSSDPASCQGMKYALVLVKAWQTDRAARQIKQCLDEGGIALTLQNGLGNDSILADQLGWARISRGVTTLGAALISPGIVRLAGDGPVYLEAHNRLQPVEELLRNAGFEVHVGGEVRSLIWSKLVISTAINPLTALLQVRNGDLLENPYAHNLMASLAREAASVAAAQGVALNFQDPVQAVDEVAQRTAKNRSSMLQDVLRGSPTEIDAINGEVVRLAHEGRVQVPVNEVILSLVKALSDRGKI